jgi:antirestriction protein ArdC
MPRESARPDLYARVTDAIVAGLEAGVRPWTQPWTTAGRSGPVSRPLRACGQPYSGVNVLLLWSEALARGFAAPTWMTFRQAQALGGQVRRGEHGAIVVYANRIRRTEATPQGEVERSIPFLKAYTVFNVEQIDGLPDADRPGAEPGAPERRIPRAEAFFAAAGAQVRYGGDLACYVLEADLIRMPSPAAFLDLVDFYATLAHECVHWTRHPSRLDRDFGRRRWGDAAYAREELVAELGAAFLCADLGLDLTPRRDHADYIGDWLGVLRDDKRFVFQAAAFAQRACDYLHGLQPAAPAAGETGGSTGAAPGA